MAMRGKNQNPKSARRLLHTVLCVVVVLLLLIVGFYTYWVFGLRVYHELVIEAGTKISASDFARRDVEIEFVTPIDTSTLDVGEYEVQLISNSIKYSSGFTVVDTVAPTMRLQKVTTEFGVSREPQNFVTELSDATSVTITYLDDRVPDFKKVGIQAVSIVAADESGNRTVMNTELEVVPVYFEREIEAGSKIPEAGFYMIPGSYSEAHYATEVETQEYLRLNPQSDVCELNINHAGEQRILITADSQTYETVLTVRDTVAPEVLLHPVTVFEGDAVTPELFENKILDKTDVKASFINVPDTTQAGEYEVELLYEDEDGNQKQYTSVLTVVKDTEPPAIIGANNNCVVLGENYAYRRGVTVTDNHDLNPTLTVDSSSVDINTCGTYPVQYIAIDSAGNQSVCNVTLTVIKKELNYTEEQVYSAAHKILDGIIKDGMTDYEKAEAIYQWVRNNLMFTGYSDKSSWIRAAYQGLTYHEGDCYVYAMTSMALLEEAEIKNMIIRKIPSDVPGHTDHYWNLIDVGEGWYHFDTSPRNDGTRFFYVTDEFIIGYSDKHHGTHNYDPAQYPTIN